MNVMQNLMQEFWNGFNAEMERQKQMEEQRRIQMERQRQLEAERLRQEAERKRREFETRKTELLEKSRGPRTTTLQPRKIDGLPELEVREVKDTFGIKTLKPRDVSGSTQNLEAGTSYPSLSRVADCAQFLVRKAQEKAMSGDYHDAAYLSREAADLMSGIKASPGVECPPLSAPEFEAGPVHGAMAKEEEQVKRTIFFSKLYGRAAEQMGDYREVLKSLKQSEQRLEQARSREQEAKTKKGELEALKEQQPETVAQSAMDEALAALKEAEAVREECEKDMQKTLATKKEMEKEMVETQHLFAEAKDKPEKISEMINRLDNKVIKED